MILIPATCSMIVLFIVGASVFFVMSWKTRDAVAQPDTCKFHNSTHNCGPEVDTKIFLSSDTQLDGLPGFKAKIIRLILIQKYQTRIRYMVQIM